MSEILELTPYQQLVKSLSDRIVMAQQPIRVLDAIKWDKAIQEDFFHQHFKELPAVTPSYYEQNSLNFNPEAKIEEFYDIELDIRRKLGKFSAVSNIMQRMCREYRELVRMIAARGQPLFCKLSQELYGSSDDAFFAGDPNLTDLSEMISSTLTNIKDHTLSNLDEKRYNSEETVAILQQRMNDYFKGYQGGVQVLLSDGIVADAAAGADKIKVRKDAMFSQRDMRVLEVHEGWVHVGTTLNGLEQPICTFLSKGAPSSTVTQEGLAIIMEIFTFASYPNRVRRLTNRIRAISMAEKGANFIEVFNFFREQELTDEESYINTTRVFRGSVPDGGAFTKDLSYSKGFVLIYNYIQLAIKQGALAKIPLLFAGKTALGDMHDLWGLLEEGLIVSPRFLPPQFADLAALSAWMCYSNFLNGLNMDRAALDYRNLL